MCEPNSCGGISLCQKKVGFEGVIDGGIMLKGVLHGVPGGVKGKDQRKYILVPMWGRRSESKTTRICK